MFYKGTYSVWNSLFVTSDNFSPELLGILIIKQRQWSRTKKSVDHRNLPFASDVPHNENPCSLGWTF